MFKINSTALRVVFALVMVALTVSFVIPVPQTGAPNDKVMHLVVFAIIGALLALAWARLRWKTSILLLVGYGFAVEIVQGVLPWRSFEWFDLAADTVGGVIGWALVGLLRRQ